MLLIEKVLALKLTEIFNAIEENELIDTASIIEEIPMEEGEQFFLKGDKGDSMYIIQSGSVRIHDGEHTFAILKEHDVFGELSLLDEEVRSASAACESAGLLLQLKQEPFYEILSDNPNVLKGILKTLCRRIRILDEQATSLFNNSQKELSQR